MFSFLIKKWFFDSWDNFLKLLIFNLGFILIMFCLVLVFDLAATTGPLLIFFLTTVVFILGGSYSGFASSCLTQFAWDVGKDFKDILRTALRYALPGLLLGAFYAVYILVIQVAIPFYGAMQNFVGSLGMGILLWGSLLWLLVSQFYLPISVQLGGKTRVVLKKSLLIFFDNTLFSLGVFAGILVILLVSLFTAFLFPGVAGILLWIQVALKLRLYKYDEGVQKPLDWKKLLETEREKMGGRTLRNLFFPWKD